MSSFSTLCGAAFPHIPSSILYLDHYCTSHSRQSHSSVGSFGRASHSSLFHSFPSINNLCYLDPFHLVGYWDIRDGSFFPTARLEMSQTRAGLQRTKSCRQSRFQRQTTMSTLTRARSGCSSCYRHLGTLFFLDTRSASHDSTCGLRIKVRFRPRWCRALTPLMDEVGKVG